MHLRHETTATLLLSFAAAAGASCGHQAFVTYVGTVTEAANDSPSSYSFDDDPPAAQPIAGAEVSVCEQSTACRATSDDGGAWGPVWRSFAPFDRPLIRVTVRSPEHESFTYAVTYPKTEDPLVGERLLNVKLRRTTAEGGAPHDGGGQ